MLPNPIRFSLDYPNFFDPNSTKNEGRLRLHDPKYFSNFFRIKSKKYKGISFVMGRDRRDNKIKPQAIRFDLSIWNEEKAKKWWESHKDEFERSWKRSDWKSSSSSLSKNSSYPKHPNTIIIPKNSFYPNGLREIDIYNHWIEHKSEVLSQLLNRNYMEVRKTTKGFVYLRRGKDFKPLRLTPDNFEDAITGRTVELHGEFKERDYLAYIDIDPHFSSLQKNLLHAKRYALLILKLLKHSPFSLERVEVAFSGNKGFHIFLYHTKQYPIDDLRRGYREFLERSFKDDPVATTSVAKADQVRLDTTLIKRRGTFKCVYSLDRRTGLCSLPLKPSQIRSFSLSQAKVECFSE